MNAPPTVTITAPGDESSFNEGESLTLTGTATDPEDGDLTVSMAWTSSLDGPVGTGGTVLTSTLSGGLHPPGTATDPEDGDLTGSMAWTSSLDGPIGTGGTVLTSTLSGGLHTITAAVTDSGGLTGTAQISLTVNAPPTVTITAPGDGSSFNEGQSITLTGTATDPEDGDLTGSVAWTSSLDGPIGTGGTVSTSTLSGGLHTITGSVTDSGGLTGTGQISLTVNAAPTVTITAPADGSSFAPGQSITLTGTATDPEDGDLTGSVAWTSSLDGTPRAARARRVGQRQFVGAHHHWYGEASRGII